MAGVVLAVTSLILAAAVIWQTREGAVSVRFRNYNGVESLDAFGGVVRIEEYQVGGKLQQVVFRKQDGGYVVFNAPLFGGFHKSPLALVPVRIYDEALFHSYDPVLEGVKWELYKEIVDADFQEYLGRLPGESERLTALSDLTQGVRPDQFRRRLQLAKEPSG